jgi:hypothetical protein
MGSLQKLLLVAFGALLLSGLTGSAVYRLAGARRRARMRRDRWPPRQAPASAAAAQLAPRVERSKANTEPPRDLARKGAAIEVEGVEMEGPDERVERVERIEEFLARLTRQLEAEMEAPRPQRQRAAG